MQKKLIVIFAVLILLVVVGFFSLPVLIDSHAVKNEVISSFKALTGLNIEIQGDAEVQSFPVPHVLINSLYVRNAPDATTPFLIKVKLIDVRPSLTSLFSSRHTIESLSITGLTVELERLKSTQLNWNDKLLRVSTEGKAESTGGILNASSISVSDAHLRYTDTPAATVSEIGNINLLLMSGGSNGQNSLRASFNYAGRPFAVAGDLGSISRILTGGTVPANLTIKSNNSGLTYEGDFAIKESNYLLKGKAALTTDDIVPWIELSLGNTAQPVNTADAKQLPLEARTDVTSEAGKILLPNLSLDGSIIKGSVQAAFSAPRHAEVKASISVLDLETLFASRLFTLSAVKEPAKTEGTSYMPPSNPFASVSMSADISVADTLYNHQHIKDTHVIFDMADGEMTIPQASASLPGESRLVFTGIGREGYQGFGLEGQLDVGGNNFFEVAKLFKQKGFAIPPEDFKRFRLKTNAIISTKEVRFSEFAARIENIGILGGIITSLGSRTKLEAALRISGLDLDHLAALWGLQEWRASFLNDSPAPKKEEFLSQWLRMLGYDLKLNTTLEQYMLNGKTRDRTDFKLEATAGKITFNNIKTSYNGTSLTGNVAIDVTGDLPRVDLNASADTLDTATFFNLDNTAQTPSPTGSERWSRKNLDFRWLDLLNATYHLKFDHFKHDIWQADALEAKGTLDSRTLNIDALTATMFGGQVAGKIVITGGKIPTLRLATNVASLNAEQLVPLLPLFQGMTGRYNMDIRLSSSGIDLASWISNLEGSVGVGGRDVTIHGFNMPGIVRAVAYVRTVADILDVVKRAFPGGDTVFSSVEGQWNVSGGVLKTSGATLKNGESDGVMMSEVDLPSWRLQSKINFALKTLDPRNPPTMSLSFYGDFDKPEKALDTRSLEQYVTNKTSEKMLNGER